MYKKKKQDLQNIETTQTDQGQKTLEHQDREENEHNVVHSQKLKRKVSTDKAASKYIKKISTQKGRKLRRGSK